MSKYQGVLFTFSILFATVFMTISALGQPEEESPSGELSLICLLGYCTFALIMTIIWLLVSVWVKNDAEANNIDSPILWGVLVFFTGLIGLLIYLLAIKPKAASSKAGSDPYSSGYGDSYVNPGTCPHCGYNAGTSAGRCPNCGGNLSG